jgi:hypothetical protein
MKNKIIIIVFWGGSLFVSAQKNNWTIGIYTGVQGQIITSIKQEYYNGTLINSSDPIETRPKHAFSNIPPVELNVKHNVRDRFSIAYGVGYRSYFTKANDYLLHYKARTDFIQIPIICQYDAPLKKKRFSFFVQWGLCFDFDIYHTSWGHHSTEDHDWKTGNLLNVVIYTKSSNDVGFNPLFFAGIGFSYQFNSGIGISLLGKNNMGLVNINKLSYHVKCIDASTGDIVREIKEQLYSRSESWNVLLGVTYTFKKKEKKSL